MGNIRCHKLLEYSRPGNTFWAKVRNLNGAEAATHKHQVEDAACRYVKHSSSERGGKKNTVLQVKTRKVCEKKKKEEKEKQGRKIALRFLHHLSESGASSGLPATSSPEGTPDGRRTQLLALGFTSRGRARGAERRPTSRCSTGTGSRATWPV